MKEKSHWFLLNYYRSNFVLLNDNADSKWYCSLQIHENKWVGLQKGQNYGTTLLLLTDKYKTYKGFTNSVIYNIEKRPHILVNDSTLGYSNSVTLNKKHEEPISMCATHTCASLSESEWLWASELERD